MALDDVLFIYDFHGCLEKDNEYAVVEVTNTVLEKRGFPQRLDIQSCREMYGKKWFEYFLQLIPGISREFCLKLQQECIAFQQSHPEIIPKYILPAPHALQTLDEIQCRGGELLLISNTNPRSIDYFLDCVGMKGYFPDSHTLAVNGHDGTGSKLDALTKFMQNKVFGKVVSVGDSPGDMELAHVCDGVSYLYAHDGLPFRPCRSMYKIRDHRQVLNEFKEIKQEKP